MLIYECGMLFALADTRRSQATLVSLAVFEAVVTSNLRHLLWVVHPLIYVCSIVLILMCLVAEYRCYKWLKVYAIMHYFI